MIKRKYEPLAIAGFVMSFFIPVVSIIIARVAAKRIVDSFHTPLKGRRLIFATFLISTIPSIVYMAYTLRDLANLGYMYYITIGIALLISLMGTSSIYSMIVKKKWIRLIASNWTVLLVSIPLIAMLFIMQSLPF